MHNQKINNAGLLESAEDLVTRYSKGDVSPVEALKESIRVIEERDSELGALTLRLNDLAHQQAKAAEQAYRDGSFGPLAGVPITIKDTFDIAGYVTTRGSALYKNNTAFEDSGVVRRLRAAGAVFVGKTNTAEFGQSATNENRLEQVARNPWDKTKTPGGSSGGAGISVAAGYVPLALGADGGGSIRIPAAFNGLYGFKPSYGLCKDEGGFRGMSDFCCPGPMSKSVKDARRFLGVLAESKYDRTPRMRALRIGLCLNPESRPVNAALTQEVERVGHLLQDMGHYVEEASLDFSGWDSVFGPLVIAEEWRERGHLKVLAPESLTNYELASLEAADHLTTDIVARARTEHALYREKVDKMFDSYDVILTPSTAVPPFEIGTRPSTIEGVKVSRIWGAFPFTPAFNVSGNPAASIPIGLSDGLPLGAQLIARKGNDQLLLDISEDIEEVIGFHRYYQI